MPPDISSMEPTYLTTSQAAARLGLSRSTVLGLVESGLLRARVLRYGSRPTIRIPESELVRFLANWADDGDGSAPRRR